MRVAVLYPDRTACACYRLIWPAEALAAQGADVVCLPLDQAAQAVVRDGVERLVSVEAPDADVVVIQRPLAAQVADAVRLWRAQGKVVVIDLDDNFHEVPDHNVASGGTDPRRNRQINRNHLVAALEEADLITVTTPALARFYGRYGPVAIVPNCLPEAWLDRRWEGEGHERTWLGWTGTRAVHGTDLEVTGGAVARVVKEQGADFVVVGDGTGVCNALELDESIYHTGLVPIEDYPSYYAALDVAIVPLAPGPFNDAKSANKMMEAAGLGVAVVGSPSAENRRINGAGVGDLARRYLDWYLKLTLLVHNEGARAEQAGRGRAAVQSMTVEANAGRWWAAWNRARVSRRSA